MPKEESALQEKSELFIKSLQDLNIYINQKGENELVIELLALARKYNLSFYNSCYLELALRKKLPIATRDKALIKAAKQCKVEIL